MDNDVSQTEEGPARGLMAGRLTLFTRSLLCFPCAPCLPGLPDAPLDVQVEPGPSPGILMISWLPVTIDAAGTSNGVRVTGYTIYADGQKVWLGDSSYLKPSGSMWALPCHA